MADTEQPSVVNLVPLQKSRQRHSSRGFLWFAVVLAFLAMASVYGFNKTFPRNGEAALSYLPDNASVVTVVDLQPSMGQYMAFRKIAESLDAHGFSAKAQDGLKMIYDQVPQAKELKPYILPSMAFAAVAPTGGRMAAGGDPSGIALISISDPSAVEKIISRGQPAPVAGKIAMYLQTGSPLYAGVVDKYLLVSSDPKAAEVVENVRSGGQGSIANSSSFSGMRNNIDSDANIMVFVTKSGAEALRSFGAPSSAELNDYSTYAIGCAIRDKGISITSFAPASDHPTPISAAMMSVQPLRSDLFNHLPEGPYGLWAMSDPAKYYDAVKTTIFQSPDTKSMFDQSDESFYKQVGLHVDDAVHLGLSGDAVVAFYPKLGGPVQGCNLLLEFDEENGANPAQVAERLRASIPNIFHDDQKDVPVFADTNYGGAKMSVISGKTKVDADKTFHEEDANSSFNFDQLMDDKTVAYATINNVLIISSSEDLLRRAIDAQQQKGNLLSSDSELASAGASIGDAQVLGAGSLGRFADGVDSFIRWDQLQKESPAQAKFWKGFVTMFKQFKQPIVNTTSFTQKGIVSRAFIPMDYDATISMLGDEMKAFNDMTAAQPNFSSPALGDTHEM
jgi:hypothetical protein